MVMGTPPSMFKCPYCGAAITNKYIAWESLTCQSCNRELVISSWYLKLGAWGGIVVTVLFCVLLGLQGLRLMIASVVLYFPITLLWSLALKRLFPPRLEASGFSDTNLFGR